MKKRGERDGIDFKGGCWGPLRWKEHVPYNLVFGKTQDNWGKDEIGSGVEEPKDERADGVGPNEEGTEGLKERKRVE
ncbi:unnamed protein product [Sphenostylis stenocarpa]|uniref:Uncharacterized protein n=1 Tax=Sphenostylis stenocarpa TaxID=92480 RepID=A0AA86VGK4_9FABA|nr:unnamed protein product [Sphenostylis stenocarpa]